LGRWPGGVLQTINNHQNPCSGNWYSINIIESCFAGRKKDIQSGIYTTQ
jgi:hypothetical protein